MKARADPAKIHRQIQTIPMKKKSPPRSRVLPGSRALCRSGVFPHWMSSSSKIPGKLCGCIFRVRTPELKAGEAKPQSKEERDG